MSIFKQKTKSSGGDFDLVPAGNHPAVLVAIIDLGTHEEEYQGKKYDSHKVYLAWELTDEPKKGGGGNQVIAREFAITLGKKSHLRALVEGWRGKPFGDDEEFDLSKVLGKSCLLNVVHGTAKTSGNTFAKVAGATPVPKGMQVKPATLKPFAWELESPEPFPDPSWLPFLYGEPVKDVIERCKENKEGVEVPPANGQFSAPQQVDGDESPF